MACTVVGDVFQPGTASDMKSSFSLKTKKQEGDRLELVRLGRGPGATVVDWSASELVPSRVQR